MVHACLGWKKVTPVLGIPRGHIARVEILGPSEDDVRFWGVQGDKSALCRAFWWMKCSLYIIRNYCMYPVYTDACYVMYKIHCISLSLYIYIYAAL